MLPERRLKLRYDLYIIYTSVGTCFVRTDLFLKRIEGCLQLEIKSVVSTLSPGGGGGIRNGRLLFPNAARLISPLQGSGPLWPHDKDKVGLTVC